jgi:putative flippase GtrA
MKKFFDASVFKFLLVGVGNTLLSAVIMFALYERAGFGYWGSSALAYIAGAVMSFFLNRYFTFHSEERFWRSALKFALNVAVCYVIAYSAAKPLIVWALSGAGLSSVWVDRISMLFGMGLYTFINYFGQRFFAFRKT